MANTTTAPSSKENEPVIDSSSSSANDAAPARRGFLASLEDDIDPKHSDIPVLLCSFVSGLCDTVAFNASSVFVSMQTGNTIFLALGTASLPHGTTTLWLRALVSIAAFWAGCLFFAHTGRFLSPKRKRTLAASFTLQSLFILASAALSQSPGTIPAFALTLLGTDAAEQRLVSHQPDGVTLAPLALLAFQFGGQIVTSRVLGFNEVPTNVLTSLYCDLLSDPKLLSGGNVKRDRRVVSALLMIGGGVVGAWLQRSRAGMPAALWIAGAVKMGIAVAWASWRGKGAAGQGVEGKV